MSQTKKVKMLNNMQIKRSHDQQHIDNFYAKIKDRQDSKKEKENMVRFLIVFSN